MLSKVLELLRSIAVRFVRNRFIRATYARLVRARRQLAGGAPLEEAVATFDRIHYACGGNVLDGWLNVDGFADFSPTRNAPQIYYVNLARPHPFPDEHWRFGYAEDFLEHLDQADSLIFLAESHRTFQPGGVLRLSFPGLEGVLARHYRSSDHAGASIGKTEAYTDWDHLHFYSFEELELAAQHIGWSSIKRVEFGASDHEALAGVDTRVEQIDLNLIVELTR